MFGLFRRLTGTRRQPPPTVEALEDRTAPAVVNIANGDVPGLIAAMTAHNASGTADTINLAAGGTFTLTAPADASVGNTGLPALTAANANTLTINGNGATIQRS